MNQKNIFLIIISLMVFSCAAIANKNGDPIREFSALETFLMYFGMTLFVSLIIFWDYVSNKKYREETIIKHTELLESVIKDFPQEINLKLLKIERCGFILSYYYGRRYRGIYECQNDGSTMTIGLNDFYFIDLARKTDSEVVVFPKEYKMKLKDTYNYIKEIKKGDDIVLTHDDLIFVNWEYKIGD